MRTLSLFACMVPILILGNNVVAQQNASVIECYTGAGVLKTLEHKTRDYKKTIAAFDLVNSENYDNWKTVLNVSIGVPFEWSTNDSYGQFHEKLERYKSEHQYKSKEAESIDDLHSFLPSEGWHAVETCLHSVTPKSGILQSLAVSGVPTDRLGDFSLKISFPDYGDGNRPVILKIETDTSVIACQPDSLDSVIGVSVLPSGNQVLCKRTSRDPGTLIVRTSWGVASADFVEISAPRPVETTPVDPNEIPQQFVGTWKGIRYEMARDNMGYVTVKYVINKGGAVTIFEYDYNATRHAKAVFSGDLNGLSFSQNLQGDSEGVSRKATATLAPKGARIPDKAPRPDAQPCGEPCLNITILTPSGDGIQQEGYLTRE